MLPGPTFSPKGIARAAGNGAILAIPGNGGNLHFAPLRNPMELLWNSMEFHPILATLTTPLAFSARFREFQEFCEIPTENVIYSANGQYRLLDLILLSRDPGRGTAG